MVAALGLRVHPLIGKRPIWGRLAVAGDERAAVERLLQPGRNYGIVCDRVAVIDTDTAELAAWWLEHMPQTPWMVRTARGGAHFYYRSVPGLRNATGVGRGWDVRAGGRGDAHTDPETGEKSVRRLRKWYGKYVDADGVPRRVPLCTDKTAAQAMLAELVRKVERQHAGIVDRAVDELGRPISDHLQDYRQHLTAKGRSDKHIDSTIRMIERVMQASRCRVLADLQKATDHLEGYLAERLQSGSSHRTINADLTAVRSFCRWLLSRKRMHNDPTVGLSKLNEEEDRRRERRALTDEEAQRLITTTDASPRVFRGLTGHDRAVIYLLAQRTGLRRKELLSLSPSSFDLTSEPATVVVQAGNSKRRKKDMLPLASEVAQIVAIYLADRDRRAPLWPGSWWRRSSDMLRDDLADAGISPVDDDGRVLDFHGQRTTFITGLSRVGVVPAMAQQLARHSDIKLTLGTYTRLTMADMAAAVGNLPELRLGTEVSQQPTPSPTVEPAADRDPDLARVIDAWTDLPTHIRQAILALLIAAAAPQTAINRS